MIEPLSLFLQAVDRTIQLFQQRRVDRNRIFKSVVEPLFKEFEPVADSYLIMFRRSARLLSQQDLDPTELLNQIDSMRDAHLVVAQKVLALSEAMVEHAPSKHVTEISEEIFRFFAAAKDPDFRKPGSRGALLRSFAEGYQLGAFTKTDLVRFVNQSVRGMEIHWARVVQLYGASRINAAR